MVLEYHGTYTCTLCTRVRTRVPLLFVVCHIGVRTRVRTDMEGVYCHINIVHNDCFQTGSWEEIGTQQQPVQRRRW
jgi:hypothetical protein